MDNKYGKLALDAANQGNWDSAIKLLRYAPKGHNYEAQIAQNGIPKEHLHHFLNTVSHYHKNDMPNTVFELAHNIPDDYDMPELNKILEHSSGDGLINSIVKNHKNYDLNKDPEALGAHRASEFWHSYETGVKPEHFAAVHKLMTGEDKQIDTHRGKSNLPGAQIINGVVHYDNPSFKPQANASIHFMMHEAIPHLQAHAKKAQDAVMADDSIKKRIMGGKPHVFLYRGVGGSYGQKIHEGLGFDGKEIKDTKVNLPVSSMSSFSTDKSMAQRFANARGEHDGVQGKGAVFGAWVPLEHILHSGFHTVHPGQEHAHDNESEIVVGHPKNTIKVPSKNFELQVGQTDSHSFVKPTVKPKEPKLAKSQDLLEKDVGRITFPKIDPKLTRPDQQIKHVGSKASAETLAAAVVNEIGKHFPNIDKAAMGDSIYGNASLALNDEPHGGVYGVNNPKGEKVKSFGFSNSTHPSVNEHEGFHYLVNKLSGDHNIPTSQIYNKINSFIHPSVMNVIEKEHQARGLPTDISNQEKFNNLRDMLTNKTRRDEILKHAPKEKHQAIMTYAKASFKDARNWARRATADDITKSNNKKELEKYVTLNENLHKGAAKRVAPFNPTKDVPEEHRAKLSNWVTDASDRDQVPMLTGPARTRGLLKLSRNAISRKNPETNEREFLLFRGKTGHDTVKNDKFSGLSSFTPDPTQAQGFNQNFLNGVTPGAVMNGYPPEHELHQAAKKVKESGLDDYTQNNSNFNKLKQKHLSSVYTSWVPESAIHHIPNAVGEIDPEHKNPHKIGPSGFADEQEVIVNTDHPNFKHVKLGPEHIGMINDMYIDHMQGVVNAQARRAPVRKSLDLLVKGLAISKAIDSSKSKSVVKDELGNLKPLYHGTLTPFSDFSSKFNSQAKLNYGPGNYFAEDPTEANNYAEYDPSNDPIMKPKIDPKNISPNVHKVFVNIKKPFDIHNYHDARKVAAAFGHDYDPEMDLANTPEKPYNEENFNPYDINHYDILVNELSYHGHIKGSWQGVSAAINKKMKELGYDGIVNREAKHWVAFSGNQIAHPYVESTHPRLYKALHKAKLNLQTGKLEPEPIDPEGMPHPDNPNYVKGTSVKIGKKPVWKYRPDIATDFDKDAANALSKFKQTMPEHAATIDKMYNSVATDSDRHVIDSGKTKPEARMRHLAWALQGKPGYSLKPTQSGFQLTAERHSKGNPTILHTWNFDGNKFKFSHSTPISNSSGGNSNEKPKSSFVVKPYGKSETGNSSDISQVPRQQPRDGSGIYGADSRKTGSLGKSIAGGMAKSVEQVLEKDIGRIAPKALVGKWNRPDQEVKTIDAPEVGPIQKKPGVAQYKYDKVAAANLTWLKDVPVNDRGDTGMALIHNQVNELGLKPQAFALAGNNSTIEHEGHHSMVDKLVQLHGLDNIHKMYKNLIGHIDPTVNHIINNTLLTNPSYKKMANHPDKRYQLTFLEEKINLLRDFVHGGAAGDRRSQLVEATQNPSWRDYFKFKDFHEIDNKLKNSWIKIRNAANNMKPEDL